MSSASPNPSRPRRRTVAVALAATLVLGATAAVGAFDREPAETTATRAAGSVLSIVCAAPFELDVAYPHDWSAERAPVASGWLVVLDVDPALVQPRQTAEPVLQIGDVALERVGRGDTSGRLVAIVPEPLDLFTSPAFFGAPALPERLDRSARRAELDAARARGIEPFPATAVQAALDRGAASMGTTGPAELADRRALIDLAAQWILEHAPGESERALDLLQFAPR